MIDIHPGNDLWCDVIDFQAQLADCRSHGHPEGQTCSRCLAPLQEAAALYQADFMAGFGLRDSAAFDDWQFFEADHLQRELASALERLILILQNQGDYSAAIEHARRWLSLDPLNESAHQALISQYSFNNQRSAALRQYRTCVHILDEELGVPPLDETIQLYESVKENRLEKPKNMDSLPVVIAAKKSEITEEIHESQNQIDRFTPLIGRSSEWKYLTDLYESIQNDGVFVALTGEAGIGKTHLAEEFIAKMQSRGAVTLSARSYAGESNLTFTPLIELLRQGIHQSNGTRWWRGLHPSWLNEVGLLVPELTNLIPGLSPSPPSDGPGAQNRFYEGVCQVLTTLVEGPIPGVILIDNLEWADESTLDILAYLIRRLPGRAICLIAAWREETSPAIARLEQLLMDANSQGGGSHLPLGALSPIEALELIEYFETTGQTFPSEFKKRLVDEFEGLPYFLVEYLQSALDGEIPITNIAEPWPVPLGLRGMLQSQLVNLSGSAYQILQAAAIIGRTFDSDLLQSISGRIEDEIIQGVEELINRKLIREVSVQADLGQITTFFDFKHETVRALVLEEISLVRTRLLHRRTAEALVEQNRFIAGRAFTGQIAFHYQRAGFLGQAAKFYFQAGQAARSMNANSDALAHYQAALSLGFPEKQDLLVEIGELHALAGDYTRAIQQFETAAAIHGPTKLPSIEQKIGQIYLRLGHWEQAACHFEAALYDHGVLASDQMLAFEAQVRVDWGLACHRNQQSQAAKSLAQEALTLAEKTQDTLALAQAHNLLGILARADQQSELATQHLIESLELIKNLDNPAVQIAALNNLALAQTDQDEYQLAIENIIRALDICIILGDRHLEAAIRSNYADLLRASGEVETAMVQLKEALSIFSDIGQKAEDWEPEIWKFVEW